MRQFLIATTNPGKFQEITAVLKDLPFKFIFLPDLKVETEFVEEFDSYEANALAKARHFAELTGLPTIADDSGMEVEALKGEMGVRTRRFGKGEKATDEEWIAYFLKRMEEFPLPAQRRARFVCVLAVVEQAQENIFSGESMGTITSTSQAPIKAGIPLSSCFLPDGCDKVYAALSEEEKGKISHRGRALLDLKQWLSRINEIF